MNIEELSNEELIERLEPRRASIDTDIYNNTIYGKLEQIKPELLELLKRLNKED